MSNMTPAKDHMKSSIPIGTDESDSKNGKNIEYSKEIIKNEGKV